MQQQSVCATHTHATPAPLRYRRARAQSGYPCLSLHGGKDQSDRECTIADFKAGVGNILIATSVAARGLDVRDLVLVRRGAPRFSGCSGGARGDARAAASARVRERRARRCPPLCSRHKHSHLPLPALTPPQVINYDVPNHIEDYVHRVGRTGRAGGRAARGTTRCMKRPPRLAPPRRPPRILPSPLHPTA
jgi:hypothetical protein